jgi:ethanolamine utilization protein EutQ (cupin superfamily)
MPETPVRKLTTDDVDEWAQVGEGGIFVADLIDQATEPGAEMTVGFARVAAGESLDIAFPYDEVLVLIRGAYTVRTAAGASHTARAGEVIYLPAGSSNASYAEEDTEMAYIASPPSVYAEHVAAVGG